MVRVVISPIDPRIQVRFVTDRELDQILREIVEPSRGDTVLSWEIRSAIRDELGLGVDEFRIRLAMERVLESCSDYVGARRSGMAFGRLRRGLSAHQRLRISIACREDGAAALSRREPLPILPAESFSEALARLL
jgi:hypothetical protein